MAAVGKMKRPSDIASLAKYILSSECKNIAILTGAGVSVAAGIPDFRSPGGMYDTLKPELITATQEQRALMAAMPNAVVLADVFHQNAFPYLEVRRPFILGVQQKQWQATLSHRFFECLHTKTGKLRRLYTQNIDGLDYQCPELSKTDKIVPVHGSIGRVACEGCGAPCDFDDFCVRLRRNIKDIYKTDPNAPDESSPIPCDRCKKPLVKPTTVLFGSSLPASFFEARQRDMPVIDLLIVAGTSLVVSPANSLVQLVNKDALRVVVNNERVGEELGIKYGGEPSVSRDMHAEGECDDIFLSLMVELGWLDALEAIRDELPEQSRSRLDAALRNRQ